MLKYPIERQEKENRVMRNKMNTENNNMADLCHFEQ